MLDDDDNNINNIINDVMHNTQVRTSDSSNITYADNDILLKAGAALSAAYSNLFTIIKYEDQQDFILRCVMTFVPLFVVNMIAVCVTLVTVLLGFRLTTLRRVFTFQLFTLIPYESVEKLAIETKAQFRQMRQEKVFKPRSSQAEDQPMTRSRSAQYTYQGGQTSARAASSPREASPGKVSPTTSPVTSTNVTAAPPPPRR